MLLCQSKILPNSTCAKLWKKIKMVNKTIATDYDLIATIDEAEKIGLARWLKNQLADAFKDARRGKTGTHDEHNFEINHLKNLDNLAESILLHVYKTSSSTAFVVKEPVPREVFAASFRDRSVHHFLYNMSADWWDRRFIDGSSSCRKGRGTLFAVKKAQQHMRRASANGTKKAWIIKCDLKGYFMSLPREKVYQRIHWGLRKQFDCVLERPMGKQVFAICDYLWRVTIMDDPVSRAVKRGNPHDWDPNILPPDKSLFNHPQGEGIVIGNLTSQLASNIYLDQLDRFVTLTLGYKNYGRYVDDFYFIVEDKDYKKAKENLSVIRQYLKDELDLTLHPKKLQIQPVSHGMEFVGARVYLRTLYPSDRLQARLKRAAYRLASGQGSEDKLLTSFQSYLGLVSHYNADQFLSEIFNNLGWDYPY